MDQILQVAGAVLILVAFAGLQRDKLSPHSLTYLVLNLVGAVVLTGVALYGSDWGFFMLELVWAVMSLWGLVEVVRGRQPSRSAASSEKIT